MMNAQIKYMLDRKVIKRMNSHQGRALFARLKGEGWKAVDGEALRLLSECNEFWVDFEPIISVSHGTVAVLVSAHSLEQAEFGNLNPIALTQLDEEPFPFIGV